MDPEGNRYTTLISIHALREEGDETGKTITQLLKISIHALREEGDPLGIGTISPIELISIHALREEGDELPQSLCLC